MPEQLSHGPEAEAQAAVQAYEQSRARFIRTVSSETEKHLLETVAKKREALSEEIHNLTTLARARHAARQQTVSAYAEKCPGRVNDKGLLPPLPGFGGADKLYRAAVKAAQDFNEVNMILQKKRETMAEMDGELRKTLEDYRDDLIKQLETPDGLANAFRVDPLLERAYNRMKATSPQRAPEPIAGE